MCETQSKYYEYMADLEASKDILQYPLYALLYSWNPL